MAIIMALLVLIPWSAGAQSTFGSIRGTVTDISGAVIGGATVKLHSLDESADRQTTTSASGDFLFENLKAGHYKVTVSHAGFSDAVVSSATLEARQELRLPITLAVTAGTTTVEVSADAALMNTENATLNHTISNVDITQLPINSRSVSSSPL
ncbi:MAG TPA: carboxypeptidase-like regulatory domain-containing protein, partial [Acidobacteriaceae bacterium]|nr:carboxypeptidase-like regulatory domain-containing protein [Acidobacteriaceae bacterium]